MESRHGPPNRREIQGLLGLCATLLIAFTAYGMLQGDESLLDNVLALVRDVVIAILGWLIGRYSAEHVGPTGRSPSCTRACALARFRFS